MEVRDVDCVDCGAVFKAPFSEEEGLIPCPQCGSTRRLVKIRGETKGKLTVTGRLTIGQTLNASTLLLQSVITCGDKTSEGVLLKAVNLPWFEIVELLQNDPNEAFKIPPRKWEEIIAGAYKKAGFEDVILTPSSGDYGRDVIAVKRGIGSVRIINQVKAYKPDHLVTADDVRALLGVLTADGASKGVLTTTSDFAPKLPQDILLKPFMPSRLELVNGKQLLQQLLELRDGSG